MVSIFVRKWKAAIPTVNIDNYIVNGSTNKFLAFVIGYDGSLSITVDLQHPKSIRD